VKRLKEYDYLFTEMDKAYKKEENKMRRLAKKHGYRIAKSRAKISGDNYGGYQILNEYNNLIEAGEKFALLLEEVEAFFKEEETNCCTSNCEEVLGNEELKIEDDEDPWA
jgi:hypothetical protein